MKFWLIPNTTLHYIQKANVQISMPNHAAWSLPSQILLIYTAVASDSSVSEQQNPWADCTDLQAYPLIL